jgi:hypothetical protein
VNTPLKANAHLIDDVRQPPERPPSVLELVLLVRPVAEVALSNVNLLRVDGLAVDLGPML